MVYGGLCVEEMFHSEIKIKNGIERKKSEFNSCRD
jgi:hypothetical protein